jgi:hypothetical protein
MATLYISDKCPWCDLIIKMVAVLDVLRPDLKIASDWTTSNNTTGISRVPAIGIAQQLYEGMQAFDFVLAHFVTKPQRSQRQTQLQSQGQDRGQVVQGQVDRGQQGQGQGQVVQGQVVQGQAQLVQPQGQDDEDFSSGQINKRKPSQNFMQMLSNRNIRP